MKKIISVISAAALTISCSSAAFAESRTIDIANALGRDEIHIIYNDTPVVYDDVKPINRQDRVMIPFRVALESMGATVDYEDAARLVTATKGDITINFTLESDTIYVNNNGVESTVTMDVPMIIEHDRTFVPIRFMSNALGMQVGWDGSTETVVIADYGEYFSKIESFTPNVQKLSNLKTASLDTMTADIEFDMTFDGEAAKFVGSVTIYKDNGASASGTFNLPRDGKTVTVPMDIIYSNGTVYIKVDLGKLVNLPIKGDEWYSIDLAKVYGKDAADIMEMATKSDRVDITDVLQSAVTVEGDAVFSEIVSMATTADVLEIMDKCLTVEETENGYKTSIEIGKKEFEEFFGFELDMFSEVLIKAAVEYDGKIANSTCDISVKDNAGDGFTFKLSAVSKSDAKGETITVPENATDILELIELMKSLG